MLNSIGLENPGIEGLLADKLPRLAELGVPLWVSVGGFAASDYAEICAALDERAEVTTIELNLSCPNVEEAPESAAEIVAAARPRTRKPLYAKLSPAATDLARDRTGRPGGGRRRALAREHDQGPRARRADARSRGSGTSWAATPGPALKPIALAAVYQCYRATGLPIVGMGGIATGRDALEFLAAGAAARGARDRPLQRPRSARPSAPRTG